MTQTTFRRSATALAIVAAATAGGFLAERHGIGQVHAASAPAPVETAATPLVITSYSIHYTKLYDSIASHTITMALRRMLARQRSAASRESTPASRSAWLTAA